MRSGHGGAGLGLILLSAATFSTSGSFATSLIDAGWSPGAVVTARVGIAALLLALPAVLAMRGRWGGLRAGSRVVVAYGLVPVAACQLCYFFAVQRLSVGMALLLEYMGIILVVGWQWARLHRRPRRLTIAGTAMAVVGLLLVLNLLGAGHLDPLGVLWALGAAVGLAAYYVLSAKGDAGVPPVAVAGGGLAVGAVALGLCGAVGLLPMHSALGPVALAGHQLSWWVPVVGLATVAAVVPYVTGIAGARLLGAKLASFVGLAEVLFGVLIAWLTLGQVPTEIQVGGGVLIVVGVALVRLDELRGAPAEPAPAIAATVR